MTTDPTVREVFREIDPDPDAVLDEFGVESPDDLVEADGTRDPDSPDELELDDSSIAALFDGAAGDDPPLEEGDATAGPSDADGDADADRAIDDLEFEFVGGADVIVRDHGDVIDASAAELSGFDASARAVGNGAAAETAAGTGTGATDDEGAEPARSDAESRTLTLRESGAADLELAGGEPATTRIADETFGTGALDGR